MDNTDLYYCVTNTYNSKLQYFGTIYILADVLLFILFFEIKLFLISLDQLQVIDLLVNSNDIVLTLPDCVASVCFTCLTSQTCIELMCVKH
jgi:hypothetical protein